jgi:membrane-associated protein
VDLAQLVDIFLHLDKHLEAVTTQYGPWVYALLFAIIFVETGVVVMPFLPGDSLLFVAGAIAGVGALNFPFLLALLFVAAVLGDNLNYAVGRRVGARVFSWEQSRLFNKEAFDRTAAFYDRWGPMAIVIGRFMPFVRTFVPFVAGVAHMHWSRFLFWNVVGAAIWVGSLTTLGFLIGNLPWVKAHFSWIALAMIVIPGLPAVFEVARHLLRRRRAA